MNPYTGDIEHFPGAPAVPSGWLQLTEEEAAEFERLPNDVRLEHYIKNHHADRCGGCQRLIGNHGLRQFKECAANEIARIDTERHERETKQFFDSLPVRKLGRETLRQDLSQHIEAMKTGK